jgi:hypothetical protein
MPALRAWFEAGPYDRAEANCIYHAALDREQAAAGHLESLSQSGARRLTGSSYGQAHCGRIARTHE